MLSRLFRAFDRHPVAGDAVLALAVLVASVLWTVWVRSTGLSSAVRDHPGTQVLFAVLLTAPLPWRRVRPGLFAVAVLAICVLQVALTRQFVAADVVALIALYTVVGYCRTPRIGAIGLAIGIVGSVGATLRWTRPFSAQEAGLGAGFLAASFLLAAALGERHRNRAAQLAALRERARLLEFQRDQQAALERARIARELHDVVAHSLSVIVVQADGGAAATAIDPTAAGGVLRTIAETSREALGQMRRLLGVLRIDSELAPQPGADRLPALIGATGLPVHLEQCGIVRSLPSDVDITVYRIVQEALTNVLKHGGPVRRVEVTLHYRDDAVEVRVEDDGQGDGAVDGQRDGRVGDGYGQGLVGMRERVELHGGSLTAGQRVEGGFAVRAVIPVP